LNFTEFLSRHISNVPQTRGWEKKIAEGPPCVVLASPGFMDFGPSRELFELWAPDSRNGVIITGYSIEGTLARVSLILIYLQDHTIPCIYLLFQWQHFSPLSVPELGKLKVPDV
jgi:Cft2 family RNA processing exonuclease